MRRETREERERTLQNHILNRQTLSVLTQTGHSDLQRRHVQDPRNIKLRGKDASTRCGETAAVAIWRRLTDCASRTFGTIASPPRSQFSRIIIVKTSVYSVNRHLIVGI